jgi:type VI protein secretion system component VasK
MLAADFGTGEVLWSFLWFFIFIIWIYLLIFIFSDIFRSEDLSGWGKAIWTILIIFLPYIGIFAYLIIRGGKMAERQAKQMQAQQSAVDSYIRTTAAGATDAEQLAKLAELHSSGKLDDAEYATAKAKVLG